MTEQKQLTKRQLAVMEALLSGELDEQQVLDKYKVSINLYNEWRLDKDFNDEFVRRIDRVCRQAQIIIASYTTLAASKLVALTASKNEETARKACLDILSLPSGYNRKEQELDSKIQSGVMVDTSKSTELSEAMASKLLEVLAKPL